MSYCFPIKNSCLNCPNFMVIDIPLLTTMGYILPNETYTMTVSPSSIISDRPTNDGPPTTAEILPFNVIQLE